MNLFLIIHNSWSDSMNIINRNKDAAIGFFDSGVGGLSVLREAIKLLPKENFIYFGDSKNAPYGTKSVEDVQKLTFAAVDLLLSKGVKTIVIACNTATSASIDDLRTFYPHIPIIGIEPALKPAVELKRPGKILIMATPVTLTEKKFHNLMMYFNKDSDIIPLPCPGLAELVESGKIKGYEIKHFLEEKLEPFKNDSIASIVLGCTHYPFIKVELSSIVGCDIPIIDGSSGTSRQLRRQLLTSELISDRSVNGTVEILNSLNSSDIIDLSYRLLNE